MMGRYIDADALINTIKTSLAYLDYEYSMYADGFIESLKDAPSIDIVRCKECKHREEYPCKVYHDDDWYCADGEREGE